VKKLLSIVLVIALIFALGATALASSSYLSWKDGFGYHCNAAKGNGKVVTGSEKATIGLTRVDGTTTWNLDTKLDNECPSCKRIDWVTFSNNNGVINGKNIQVNHSANPVYVAKASAELVLIDIVINKCNETETKTVTKAFQSGTFATNQAAVFNFDIPAGYEIIAGTNPVTLSFEAKAGQDLFGKVVAEKITIIECECLPDEDDTPPEFLKECDHSWHCPNCIGNGNNQDDQGHKNCVGYCSGSQGNTKFECVKCNTQAHSKNVLGGIYCACPLCN